MSAPEHAGEESVSERQDELDQTAVVSVADSADPQPATDITVPSTAEPRVDAALALLAGIEALPPTDAATVLGQVHERLHGTLLEP